jgi:hypothetical protein
MKLIVADRTARFVSFVGPAEGKGAVTYTLVVHKRHVNVPARVAERCKGDIASQLKRGVLIVPTDPAE